MMKHMAAVISAALVLMFAAVAITSAADTGAVGPAGLPSEEFAGPHQHRHSPEWLIKKLGITDEQKKQIRALYVASSDRTRKARTELMALKDEKKTMLLSGKIDQQKLSQMDDQMVKLKSELLKERLKMKRDRLALLTPEQIDRLADLMAHKAFRSKMKKLQAGHKMGFMQE